MSSSITLDVVVPTRNRAKQPFLPRTLESLLAAQARIPAGLEVRCTIVDNGSDDETRQVVERIAERGGPDFMRYAFEPTAGRSSAINHAIGITKGDWIVMFDDDEVVFSTWFADAYGWLRRPDLDFFGGGYQPDWEAPPPPWLPKAWPGVVGQSNYPTHAFTPEGNAMLHGGNACIRRSALAEIGLYRTNLTRRNRRGQTFGYEDMDIFQRLLRAGKHGWYVRELSVRHWIPARRLTKRYHRAWAWNHGIIRAAYDDGFPRPSGVVYWGKTPRYMFREAGKQLRRIHHLDAQMFLLHFLGQLCGHYGARPRSAPPAGSP